MKPEGRPTLSAAKMLERPSHEKVVIRNIIGTALALLMDVVDFDSLTNAHRV